MKDEGKKEYEISYLLAAPESEAEVLSVLKQNGAEITHQKPSASITLAYPIKKHAVAYFGFCHFNADTSAIRPIDDILRLQKGLIRFLIITPPVKMAVPRLTGDAGRPERPTTPTTAGKPGKPEKKVPAPAAISNEALSEKLEEILK